MEIDAGFSPGGRLLSQRRKPSTGAKAHPTKVRNATLKRRSSTSLHTAPRVFNVTACNMRDSPLPCAVFFLARVGESPKRTCLIRCLHDRGRAALPGPRQGRRWTRASAPVVVFRSSAENHPPGLKPVPLKARNAALKRRSSTSPHTAPRISNVTTCTMCAPLPPRPVFFSRSAG
jgi:hypothetical protein